VYRSANEIEEAQAIATHFLTLTERNSLEPRVAIRIYSGELQECGIGLSAAGEVPGTTGYAPVDQRHFDLKGQPQSFQRLTSLIVADFEVGGDRMRHLGKYQLYRLLKDFLDHDEQLGRKARSRCERLVNSAKIPHFGQEIR
jgi:hypothetical protein